MRKLITVLVPALALGFGLTFAHADDSKDAKKDEQKTEKKGGCCDEGCKDGEKGTAKKDEEGCEGCGKSEKSFAKLISCDACKNSEKGPCEKCVTALKEGKVTFVPVSGMMCSNCEGAVATKLEKVDGVAKYAVNHRFEGIAIFVEPGKTVKLSDLKTALGKFEISEDTKLAGQYTLIIKNATDQDTCTAACEILCKLLGIKDCKACAMCVANGFTFNATGKDVTLKQIKEKLAEKKIELADVEIRGPKVEDKTKG
jgi:copper chaperone CopZ